MYLLMSCVLEWSEQSEQLRGHQVRRVNMPAKMCMQGQQRAVLIPGIGYNGRASALGQWVSCTTQIKSFPTPQSRSQHQITLATPQLSVCSSGPVCVFNSSKCSGQSRAPTQAATRSRSITVNRARAHAQQQATRTATGPCAQQQATRTATGPCAQQQATRTATGPRAQQQGHAHSNRAMRTATGHTHSNRAMRTAIGPCAQQQATRTATGPCAQQQGHAHSKVRMRGSLFGSSSKVCKVGPPRFMHQGQPVASVSDSHACYQ